MELEKSQTEKLKAAFERNTWLRPSRVYVAGIGWLYPSSNTVLILALSAVLLMTSAVTYFTGRGYSNLIRTQTLTIESQTRAIARDATVQKALASACAQSDPGAAQEFAAMLQAVLAGK